MNLKCFKILLMIAAIHLVISINSYAEDKVVARVNEVAITESQVEAVINELMPNAFYHVTLKQDKRAAFRPEAIEEIIKRELYYQEAVRLGLRVQRSELNEAIDKIKGRFKSKSDFQKTLKASGTSMEAFEKATEKGLLINKFSNEEILSKSKVTDEYLKDYYEKTKRDFIRPEALKIRHILIKVDPASTREEREKIKKEAADILARARKGEDFGELAYNYSADQWRVKGGDLGLVHRGRLEAALDEVAFKLEIGQISDLTETIYGYHILKLDEKVPPIQLSFDEIRDKLRKQVEGRLRSELLESTLKRLKQNARIEIYQ